MGLLDHLNGVAGRLGIVQIVSTSAPAEPTKVPTRKIKLADLMQEGQTEQVRTLAELPAELSVEFAKIFEAAGVKPGVWGVERLQQALASEQFKNLDRAAAQKQILALLAADKGHVHEVVADAMARDQALDAFEVYARSKVDKRRGARDAKCAELTDQIQSLQQQVQQLQAEGRADIEQWRQWHNKKIEYEKQLARVVDYLVDKPVISVDTEHET